MGLAAALDPNPNRPVHAGSHFRSKRAGNRTELECSKAVSVQCHVGIGSVWIQTLADDEHRLAMILDSLAREENVRGQGEVTVFSLPDKMKCIDHCPHIGAAARNSIFALGWIVGSRTRPRVFADIGMPLEQAYRF